MGKCAFLSIAVSLFSISVFGQTDHTGSGRAIRFDGVNDFIDLGNIYDDLVFPFSVSAWVYMDPANTIPGPIMVSQDNNPLYNGFWFFVGPSQIFIEYGDGRGENLPEYRRGKSATGLNLNGRWFHAAAVVKGISNIDLYINGINVGGSYQGSSPQAMSSSYPADIAKVGYFFSNSVIYRFNGIIDELRVYNIALTESDIRNTMCKRLNGNEAGLIGYWDFDETSGATVFDRSAKGFNGTLLGNPQRVISGAPVGNKSVNSYRSNWSGVKIQMEDGPDKVEVSNITGSPQGLQIYEVLDLPSQSSGLPATISQPYFGVFAASINSTPIPYNVNYMYSHGSNCDLFVRADNSVPAWNGRTNPLTGVNTRIEVIRGQISSSVNFNVQLGNDQILCDQSSTSLSANVDPSDKVFLWNTGAQTSSINVTQSGTYSVAVTEECFTDRDTIVVQFLKAPLPFSLGTDKLVCKVDPFVLKTLQDTLDVTLTWQDNSNKTSYTVTQEGLYWLKKENACGIARDSVNVKIKVSNVDFDVELGNDQTLCDQSSTSISANIDPSDKVFLWSTGEQTSSINITQSGIYNVAVTQECLTVRDTIAVQFFRTPSPFSLGQDKLLCGVEPFVLKTLQDTLGVTLTWQDNSNKTSYTVTKEGLYWLKKENTCGVAIDSVNVSVADFTRYAIPNIITPNGDPLNQHFILHPLLLGSSLAVYNRWGKQVFFTSDYQNGWDGNDLPAGVYFYTLSSQCIQDRKGTIQIVR